MNSISLTYQKYLEFIKKPFEERKEDSIRVMTKYPDRVPIVIITSTCVKTNNSEKIKYLVPLDLTVGQFMYTVRRHYRLNSNESLFFFINKSIFSGNTSFDKIYENNKSDDGFLYITISRENTFG